MELAVRLATADEHELAAIFEERGLWEADKAGYGWEIDDGVKDDKTVVMWTGEKRD